MKHVIAILGAGMLSLAGGAALGTAIPTEPLSSGTGLADIAPPIFHRNTTAQAGPNHYPLKTSGGVVPVEELSMHGLYRNRYRPFTPELSPRFSDAAFDPEAEPSLAEMAGNFEAVEVAPLPEAPLREAAARYASNGARAIDVAQELSRLR